MGIIIYSIKSMSKKWFKYLIIFIQLVILIIVLHKVFSLVFYKDICRNKANSIVDTSKLLKIEMDVDEYMNNYNNKKEEKVDFFNYIINNNNIENWYKIQESSISVEQDEIIKKYGVISEAFNKNELNLLCKEVNYDYLNFIDNKISEGRNLNKQDLEKYTSAFNEINKVNMSTFKEMKPYSLPVIAGSDFAKDYNIGDIIKSYITIGPNEKIAIDYEIVGFIQENTKVITDGLGVFYQSIDASIDNYIIKLDPNMSCEKYDRDNDDYISNRITPSILYLSHKDDSKTLYEIQKLSDELGLGLKVLNYEDTLKDTFDYMDNTIKFEILKSIIIFSFIIVGVVASLFALVEEFKDEIATLVAVGFNNKKIISIFSLQYLIMSLTSFFVGINLAIFINDEIKIGLLKNTVNIFNTILPLGIIIGIYMIIFIGIYLTIKKNSPSELIGGFRE